MPRRTISTSSTTSTRRLRDCMPPPRGEVNTSARHFHQHTPTRWGVAVQWETPRSDGLDAIQLRSNDHFQNRSSAADGSADCENCIRDCGMFVCQQFQSSAYVFELLGFVQQCLRGHMSLLNR